MLSLTLSIGVYILGVVWGTTFLLCWVTIRTKHSIGKIAILVASLITLLVLALPKIEIQLVASQILYDKYLVVRYCTISLLLLSAVIGCVCGYYHHCIEYKDIRKIRSFGS